MGIPDYQTIMLPLLRFAGDGQEHLVSEGIEKLGREFDLTEEERNRLLPSGKQAIFDNRVHWARTYLNKAGLLENPQRSYFKITQRGIDVLAEKPKEISSQYLMRFPEFEQFKGKPDKASSPRSIEAAIATPGTPEEQIENAHDIMREQLKGDILASMRRCSFGFFERLVVNLLLKMGYGSFQHTKWMKIITLQVL